AAPEATSKGQRHSGVYGAPFRIKPRTLMLSTYQILIEISQGTRRSGARAGLVKRRVAGESLMDAALEALHCTRCNKINRHMMLVGILLKVADGSQTIAYFPGRRRTGKSQQSG